MLTASGPGGINEIQYAALLMMIARHCGLEAGVFTHFIANEQIYNRHIEQAKEMMNRYEDRILDMVDNSIDMDDYFNRLWKRPKPRLVLNPEKTNFFEMTIDDFTMENYEPIKPQLKLELGI